VTFAAEVITPLLSNVSEIPDVVLPTVLEVTLFATCIISGVTFVI
jgi:hypothetical protein